MVRERGSKQMRQVKIGDEAGEQIEDDKDKRGVGGGETAQKEESASETFGFPLKPS